MIEAIKEFAIIVGFIIFLIFFGVLFSFAYDAELVLLSTFKSGTVVIDEDTSYFCKLTGRSVEIEKLKNGLRKLKKENTVNRRPNQ